MQNELNNIALTWAGLNASSGRWWVSTWCGRHCSHSHATHVPLPSSVHTSPHGMINICIYLCTFILCIYIGSFRASYSLYYPAECMLTASCLLSFLIRAVETWDNFYYYVSSQSLFTSLTRSSKAVHFAVSVLHQQTCDCMLAFFVLFTLFTSGAGLEYRGGMSPSLCLIIMQKESHVQIRTCVQSIHGSLIPSS